MTQRQLLLSGGALIAAALIGFYAGHSAHAKAGTAVDQTADAGTSALPSTFTVSAGALPNMQLHYASAALRPLIRDVPATGIVTYDALRLARIVPPARGRVESIDAVVGEQVQAGQRLAVLDNFELSAARSSVASAKASVTQAQSQLAAATAALRRAEDLVRSGGMAQSELDTRRAAAAAAAANLRTQQATLQQGQDQLAQLMPIEPGSAPATPGLPDPRDSEGAIVAPFAGVVDSVALSAGQMVDPSQPVFTVADLSSVWVPLQVPENQIGAVQIGDPVAITTDAYPGRVFTGQVSYIADQVDPNTGTIMVRCIVPNQDGALRVDMFVNGTIESALGRQGVLVPSSALQDINGQSVVFSPAGNGRFTWHAVQPGLSTGDDTQILSGVTAGTPVVTDGSYWLKATLMQSTIPDEG
jgi:cobalt-zinc-cadmium efflux system membrane fusion protein